MDRNCRRSAENFQSEEILLSYYRTSVDYRDKLNRHTSAYYRFYIGLLRPESPNGRFLDVGCGTGEAALFLGAQGYGGTGIDVSPLFIENAREKAASQGIKGVEFVEGSVDALPFGPNTFSSAGSYEVFEHLYHPDRVIAEIARVLKPGGKVIIAAPNYLSPVNHIGDPLDNSSPAGALKYFLKKASGPTFYRNIWRIFSKEFFGDETLRFREIREQHLTGSGGDEDAAFVCNPPDIIRLMRRNGIDVKFFSSFGYRSPFLNGVISSVVNRIPVIRFMGWGTFVLGVKKGPGLCAQGNSK